jgi:hypothetical protein
MEKLILQLQMLQMLFSLDDFLKSSHQQSNVKICSAVRRTAVPPVELYATQLATARNVHAAVDRLLGNMGQYNMMMIIIVL